MLPVLRAPRDWVLVDGQAAPLALLAHRNGCDPSYLWAMAYTYQLGFTAKWDLGMKTHQKNTSESFHRFGGMDIQWALDADLQMTGMDQVWGFND